MRHPSEPAEDEAQWSAVIALACFIAIALLLGAAIALGGLQQ